MSTSQTIPVARICAVQETNPPPARFVDAASGRAAWPAPRRAFTVGAQGNKRRMLRVPLAGLVEVVIGTTVALAPQASATGQDDNFLALLAQAGVPAHDNIPSVIDYGHRVCEALDGGESASEVIDAMANYSHAEDPAHDLGQYHRSYVKFVGVSVRAFCPGNEGKLAAASRSDGRRRIVLSGLMIPNPPQIPPQPAPPVALLAPPVASPSPAPKQAPLPKQVPPPPPVVKPPVATPQEGTGAGGGTGNGVNGGGQSEGVPAQPAPQLPEGHIVLAP